MRPNFEVTCQTASKSWSKSFSDAVVAESYAAEMTKRYRARCTVSALTYMTKEGAAVSTPVHVTDDLEHKVAIARRKVASLGIAWDVRMPLSTKECDAIVSAAMFHANVVRSDRYSTTPMTLTAALRCLAWED
jgi:hypothetical protein